PGRVRLGHADPVDGVDHLPLQIADVDDVEVDQPDSADPGGGQIEGGGGAEATGADEEHPGVEELALSLLADLGDQQMAAVPLFLLRAQGAGDDEGMVVRLPGAE